MAKKRFWRLIGLGVFVLLSSFIIYRYYFSQPGPFPTNEELVDEMNSVFPEAAASEIQAAVSIDEHRVVVPFISNRDDYSLSYWKWERGKWSAVSIHTNGSPMVWKMDNDHPSTFHFVWNIHPEDKLDSIHYYLIRDRDYRGGDGERTIIQEYKWIQRSLFKKIPMEC